MKTVSAELAEHLAGEVTFLCTCLKATLTNGTVIGFTDHDEDIIFGEDSPTVNTTYLAEGGYIASDVQTSSALNVDNAEIRGMLTSPAITEADMRSGIWDFARIEIFQVNWRDISQGRIKQRVGWLGEVRNDERDVFAAELRGIMQAYSRVIVELTSPSCRANLGDSRCKVNLAPYTFEASVYSVSADNRTIVSLDLNQDTGYFGYGILTFTSGENLNLSMEVKIHTRQGSPNAALIVLQLPMPFPIATGSPSETFTIVAGCGKRFIEDCKTKFDNVVNFRGEPHVRGMHALVQVGRRT